MSPLCWQFWSMQMKLSTQPSCRSPLGHFRYRILIFFSCYGSMFMRVCFFDYEDIRTINSGRHPSPTSQKAPKKKQKPSIHNNISRINQHYRSMPKNIKCLNNFRHLIITFQPMPQPTIEHLYQQNQRLGHHENNFYRITINNIKKLNTNINKHLSSTTNNKKANSSQNVVDPRTVGDSYIAITNKIHLKNLQMKVGNMKRKVDKFQKVHAGSITSLAKQAEILEKEVNVLSREYQLFNIQNMLLDNLSLQDYLVAKISLGEYKPSSKMIPRPSRDYNPCPQMLNLEDINLKTGNKLEHLLKEEKQLRQQKTVILSKLDRYRQEKQKLQGQIRSNSKNVNLRVAQAAQIQKLQSLTMNEAQLQRQIKKQDLLLEEQYKINQEYKQKILDRNQLEVKDIKGLQEKIKKREDEVRDIKAKCQLFQQSKSKVYLKSK